MNVIICYLSMLAMQFSVACLSSESDLHNSTQSTKCKNQVQINSYSAIIKTSKSNLPCPFKTRNINKDLSFKKRN